MKLMTRTGRAAGWLLGGLGLLACGNLSDADKATALASVTGSLSAADVPAGAHVALVWRHGAAGGLVVTNDTPLENGKFTFDLTAPPADDLFYGPSDGTASPDVPVSVGTADPSTPPPTPAPAPASDAGVATSGLRPLTEVGGEVSTPMTVAVAGFVVYVDANGNGKLDVEGSIGSSPDTIVGGNEELFLAYLRGGTTLAYEKMRDKAGQVPTRGYDLFWTEGRVLPLNAVELELKSHARLAYEVCGASGNVSSGGGAAGGGSTSSPGTEPAPVDAGAEDAATPSPYPSPNDPNLHCSADGYSYTYGSCPAPVPQPEGLCTSGFDAIPPCAQQGGGIPYGTPIPAGWPCPIAGDAGPPVPEPTDGGLPTDPTDAAPMPPQDAATP